MKNTLYFGENLDVKAVKSRYPMVPRIEPTVAVGTPVARRPPHGSVREGLLHTALTLGC